MLHNLYIATGITVALVLGWVAVQGMVRRYSPEMEDSDDVLACRMCEGNGHCHCGLRLLKKETSNDGQNDAA